MWRWCVLVLVGILVVFGGINVLAQEQNEEAQYPNIEVWESFVIIEEPDDGLAQVGAEGGLEFLEPSAEQPESKAEGTLLELIGSEPTAERIAELARLRFGNSLDLVNAWQRNPDEALLEQALDSAQSAVTLEDGNALYWAWLGWLYAAGSSDPLMDALAERALLTSLKLNPAAPRTRQTLARLYLGRGETDRALEQFHRLLETVPSELSSEIIAETAKTYSETGRAREGAAYFARLRSPTLDSAALLMAQGGLRLLAGERDGADQLRQLQRDPEAGPGVKDWASVLLDPQRLHDLWRAAEPTDLPLQPLFWRPVGEAVIAVQDAALLLGLDIDERLQTDCERLVDADKTAFDVLFPPGRSPSETARAHAAFYQRAVAELDRLAPAIQTELAETIPPMEEAVEEETDADEALESAQAVMEFYASALEALSAYIHFSPENEARLMKAAGLAVGTSPSQAVLDPLRAKLVEWHDFTLELNDHIALLESEESSDGGWKP